MPIDPLLGLALFMPFIFAVAASALSFRHIKRRIIFFVLATFTFAGAQDIAYVPIHDLTSQKEKPVAEMIKAETTGRFIADIFAAIVGGLIIWRTAIIFRRRNLVQDKVCCN